MLRLGALRELLRVIIVAKIVSIARTMLPRPIEREMVSLVETGELLVHEKLIGRVWNTHA